MSSASCSNRLNAQLLTSVSLGLLMGGLAGLAGSGFAPPASAQLPPLGPPTEQDLGTPDLFPPFTPPSPGSAADPSRLPGASPQSPGFDDYRLGPGDAFFISVQRFPDLSFQGTLDIQGNVIVPLAGATSFDGLTLTEAENLVRQLYDQFVINPDVTLTLTNQRPVQVTILGEIQRPGFYPLPSPQVSAALLTAGGTTNMADLREIEVTRQLRNGELITETIDLFTPLKQGTALPDLRLENGDVVRVARLNPAQLDGYDRDLVARSTIAQQQIQVRVISYASSRVGTISLPNGSRFVDAVGQLGLNPDQANIRSVGLVRFDEESGQTVTTNLNAQAAFQGDPGQNPSLQDNDVIVVGRGLLARVTFALNTFTQPFRDVLGFLLFFDSLANSAENLFRP